MKNPHQSFATAEGNGRDGQEGSAATDGGNKEGYAAVEGGR